uniref:Uncharacterized protein n=1 Tax=Phasianus colchicus TaxID=9054 RepID=A0A669P7S7_PHACC
MVFSGKYSRSPIASTNLVLKHTVFVNKFTRSTHELDVITILLPSVASVPLHLSIFCCSCCILFSD